MILREPYIYTTYSGHLLRISWWDPNYWNTHGLRSGWTPHHLPRWKTVTADKFSTWTPVQRHKRSWRERSPPRDHRPGEKSQRGCDGCDNFYWWRYTPCTPDCDPHGPCEILFLGWNWRLFSSGRGHEVLVPRTNLVTTKHGLQLNGSCHV